MPFANLKELEVKCVGGFLRLGEQLIKCLPLVADKVILTVPETLTTSISHLCKLALGIECSCIMIKAERMCADIEVPGCDFDM